MQEKIQQEAIKKGEASPDAFNDTHPKHLQRKGPSSLPSIPPVHPPEQHVQVPDQMQWGQVPVNQNMFNQGPVFTSWTEQVPGQVPVQSPQWNGFYQQTIPQQQMNMQPQNMMPNYYSFAQQYQFQPNPNTQGFVQNPPPQTPSSPDDRDKSWEAMKAVLAQPRRRRGHKQ